MSDDLIKRAREAAEPWDYGEPDTLITELVDRIIAQAAEIERLRDLLAEAVEYPASGYLDNDVLNRVYAALEGKAEQ